MHTHLHNAVCATAEFLLCHAKVPIFKNQQLSIVSNISAALLWTKPQKFKAVKKWQHTRRSFLTSLFEAPLPMKGWQLQCDLRRS
jgi:hypothetical protein